jgi:hypothetical protein
MDGLVARLSIILKNKLQRRWNYRVYDVIFKHLERRNADPPSVIRHPNSIRPRRLRLNPVPDA